MALNALEQAKRQLQLLTKGASSFVNKTASSLPKLHPLPKNPAIDFFKDLGVSAFSSTPQFRAIANANNFANTFSKVPELNFSQTIQHPALRIAASVPENIINSPRTTAIGLQGLKSNVAKLYTGQPVSPQNVLANFGRSLDLPLNLYTGGAGKAIAKNITEQGFRRFGQQGVKQAFKDSFMQGGKTGLGFGSAEGFKSGENLDDPFEYIMNLASNVASGSIGGAALGGVLGAGGYGLNKAVGDTRKLLNEKALQSFSDNLPNLIKNRTNPVYMKYSRALSIDTKTENEILKAGQFIADSMDDPKANDVLTRSSKQFLPKEFHSLPAPQLASIWNHIIARKHGRIVDKVPFETEDLDKAIFNQFGQTGKINFFEDVSLNKEKQNNLQNQLDPQEASLGKPKAQIVEDPFENIVPQPNPRLVELLNYSNDLLGRGYSKKQVDRIGINEYRKIAKENIPPWMHDSYYQTRKGSSIETPLQQFKDVSTRTMSPKIGKDSLSQIEHIDDIIDEFSTDVKKKVNVLDYFRTPNRVLEKIGLGDEAKLLRAKYEDYKIELPKEIEKVTLWSKRVDGKDSNRQIFRWLDGEQVKLSENDLKVAQEIKQYFKEWAGKLKLPLDKQISNYITHLFEKGSIEKEFDPELARLIDSKVVGSVYSPFLQHRTGKPEYIQDTWRALDAYVKRSVRKFHMDQALERVSQKSESLPLESYNYIKNHIARINMQPTELDNLIDNAIKASPIGYKLGQRPTTSVTQNARRMVSRGLLGLNPGSALRNLQQSTNTYSVVGEKNFAYGLYKTLQNMPKYILGRDTELVRVGVLGNDIIQDRQLNATRKFWENADKGFYYLFDQAEKINRSIAYYGGKSQALSKGYSEKQAIEYAKDVVAKTQFIYDTLDTPAVLQSDIAKTLFQFAKYPVSQTEFLAEMVKRKDVIGSIRWTAANLLFLGTAGKALGLDYSDMFPKFRFGVPPTLQAPWEAGKAIVNAPDKYGNTSEDPNPATRLLNSKGLRKGLMNYFPAGNQISKTGGYLLDVQKGGSYTPSGNKRFDVNPSVKGALFGSYSTPEGKEYLDNLLGRNLTPEEKQAKEINKQQEEASNKISQLAESYTDQLKKAKTKQEKVVLLRSWVKNKTLNQDVIDKMISIARKGKIQGNFAKATNSITTNQGKARFIKSYLKTKSSEQKRTALIELIKAGLFTDSLIEEIIMSG